MDRREFLKRAHLTAAAAGFMALESGCASAWVTLPTPTGTPGPTPVVKLAPASSPTPTFTPVPLIVTPTLTAAPLPSPTAPALVPAGDLLLDTFTGPGALAAHTPEFGGPWTVISGVFELRPDGTLGCESADIGLALASDLGVSDYEIECAVLYADNRSGGMVFRSQNDGSARFAAFLEGGRLRVVRYNTQTDQAGAALVSPLHQELISGRYYRLGLKLMGSWARYSVDGELAAWDDDVFLKSGSFCGVASSGSGAVWDSLSIRRTPAWKKLAFIGDSISAPDSLFYWPSEFCARYNGGRAYPNHNHARIGASIMEDMLDQVKAASGDDADLIFILFGTNDDKIGAALRNRFLTCLNLLKSSNPRAAIYVLSILQAANRIEAERVRKNRLIADAVSEAGGVTLWDTTGWIDPAPGVDTIEGLHPNASGTAKIVREVLSRMP